MEEVALLIESSKYKFEENFCWSILKQLGSLFSSYFERTLLSSLISTKVELNQPALAKKGRLSNGYLVRSCMVLQDKLFCRHRQRYTFFREILQDTNAQRPHNQATRRFKLEWFSLR